MRTRIFHYPATPMLAMILLYAIAGVPPEGRLRAIVLLSMTAISATELMLAIATVMRDRKIRDVRIASHIGLAIAAGIVAFSLLDPMKPAVFGFGCVVFGLTVVQSFVARHSS